MRKPRNLEMYTDAESAARGLERLARDIRQEPAGMLIRWNINLSRWHPAWEDESIDIEAHARIAGGQS